jgi:hypothetical protein
MALTRRHRILVAATVAAASIAALMYLRDPPWLLHTTSGMRGWEADSEGTRFRWMGGHASLFVPSDARAIEIPVRTTFDQAGDWSVTASVTIDDRPSDQIVLADGQWHSIVLRMPAKGSRRVRRVDIRLDRTRDDNRGAAIGEVRIR